MIIMTMMMQVGQVMPFIDELLYRSTRSSATCSPSLTRDCLRLVDPSGQGCQWVANLVISWVGSAFYTRPWPSPTTLGAEHYLVLLGTNVPSRLSWAVSAKLHHQVSLFHPWGCGLRYEHWLALIPLSLSVPVIWWPSCLEARDISPVPSDVMLLIECLNKVRTCYMSTTATSSSSHVTSSSAATSGTHVTCDNVQSDRAIAKRNKFPRA
jgi:hypothetical protein